jgi:hypothetical protein
MARTSSLTIKVKASRWQSSSRDGQLRITV